MATVISLVNMKGGVGKTTLCAQLAHKAASYSHKVLAIDLDPQANLSQVILGTFEYRRFLKQDPPAPTIAQVFDRFVPSSKRSSSPRPIDINDTILEVKRKWRQIDLIPSRLEFARTLRDPAGKELALAMGIAQIADQYDLIVIDCPPTESVLTDAAYHSSRYLLVPVKLEYLATVGLPLLAKSIDVFRMANADHSIDICGIVLIHRAYGRDQEHDISLSEVRAVAKKRNWHVFETEIHWSRSFARASRNGLAVWEAPYQKGKPDSQVSSLFSELRQQIGLPEKEWDFDDED